MGSSSWTQTGCFWGNAQKKSIRELKNMKKISFDAPFSCDSEYHNRNFIEIREKSEKKLFCRETSSIFDTPLTRGLRVKLLTCLIKVHTRHSWKSLSSTFHVNVIWTEWPKWTFHPSKRCPIAPFNMQMKHLTSSIRYPPLMSRNGRHLS